MALSRGRGSHGISAIIWPGFVDALTTLLLILIFLVTIFMVVQFTLREQITTKEHELADLSVQIADLADALGLERQKSSELTTEVAGLNATIDDARAEADRQTALIATLRGQIGERDAAIGAAEAKITAFEAQVASLLSERDAARGQVSDLTTERDKLLTDQEALNLAVAKARSEIDAQAEAARLAAARREALEALVANLKAEGEAAGKKLTEAETARLTEAAAAQALRDRLKGAEDELTAMTLALEAQRKKAEETLTLLAAAEAAQRAEADKSGTALSEADRQRALLATANEALSREKAASAEAARKVALLNQQVAALRTQLGSLQSLLDASEAKDAEAKVQIDALGTRLNSALAQVASEQKRRAELEEAERIRLEAEAKSLKEQTVELARYRSEFFGKLSQVLAGREGVRVVGDRFVFSSEVLFNPGA
ncbi:MAG: peptidoglycan -binding protein, partial [Albidovulum sp.]